MRALILANGEIGDGTLVRMLWREQDLVICADGGLAHARALALRPHWLIGDLDSVQADWLQALDSTTQVVRYPTSKNETDLELALQKAAELGVTSALVAGTGGGRLDHALANILLLAQQRWPFRLSFVQGAQLATVLHGPAGALLLEGLKGQLVSLLPLPEASGVQTQGLDYPLTDESLAFGSPRGISNVMSSSRAIVQLKQGTLLVIQNLTD